MAEGQRRDEGRRSPHDRDTLARAVARMTEAARAAGSDGLVMPVEDWRALVERYLYSGALSAFGGEVIKRAGPADDVDDLNRFLDLASGIWSATPQRDRGGMTANELANQGPREHRPAPED